MSYAQLETNFVSGKRNHCKFISRSTRQCYCLKFKEDFRKTAYLFKMLLKRILTKFSMYKLGIHVL